MRAETPSGLQIAFLSFAVLLLAVPLSSYLAELQGATTEERDVIGRGLPFLLGALLLATFPRLRRRVGRDLSVGIPAEKRTEVLAVTIAKLSLAVAFMGASALWHWTLEGGSGLERHMGPAWNRDAQLAFAFSPMGLVFFFLVAAVLGPLIEELLFRDFLQRAWEKRWGWLPAMLMTSTLFAIYHRHFVPSFLGGIVYACLVRRTGSLWSAIAAHSVFNAAHWYPLLGQFLMPAEGLPIGELDSWRWHLACLAFVSIALPGYVLVARKSS